MKLILGVLLALSVALAAEAAPSSFWDASKNAEIAPGYKAFAGPVWNTPNNDSRDLDRTPPDFYRVSIEKKTAQGWETLIEKKFALSDVDWPRLKTIRTEQIIRYHEATRRVAFFLKGDHATFVQPLPSSASTPANATIVSTEEALPPSDMAGKTDPNAPVAADLAKAKRFVPDVVFYVEKGKREYLSKRWVTRPRLELISQDKSLSATATALYEVIFEAAGPLPPGENKITVYLGPAKELTPIRNKLSPQMKENTWSYWTNWNAKREFTQATIFILTDRMDDYAARHALARCFMGAVGFPDTSKEYKESILNPDNQAGELSPIDKRVISFIYKNTAPGIGREALLAQLSQHWK
ncbi:MAG: hypothetical protein JF599_01385 [Verrucomicrobia bacterium]|nr:hypothetical protein [Verrucomicrobiota bacterium]